MTQTEAQLSQVLQQAVARISPAGSEPAAPGRDGLPRWEIPKDPAFGDLANSAAFRLAARQKQPPQQIAQQLAELFPLVCRKQGVGGLVDRVEPKGGYLNVFLSRDALGQMVRDILKQGAAYGNARPDRSAKVNIEFVSANPTGPLSVAHGRQAAVGDVLARLLGSQGQAVTKEYYLNDEGRQIEMLGKSLRARALAALGKNEPFPEDGYHGAYVTDSAARLVKAQGAAIAGRPLEYFMKAGMDEQWTEILRVLGKFGLSFDTVTSQRELRESGKQDAALAELNALGALYDADDATWFASTKFGDDKDRVVKKRDGEMTYLAPDIAYHQWKFKRGFDQIINLWGPDHHGYIGRIKAAVKALGLPDDRLTVRIVQLVTLTRQGKPVPMSKRQGEFVTFEEILEEVGVDATRFFYVMRTMDSPLDFDLDLAKAQSQDNPVYYVQYAHARICSILAKHRPGVLDRFVRPPLDALDQPEERLLMRWLFQYPIVLRLCAAALEPQGLTVYLRRLAEAFHVFYSKHRVISDDRRRTAARVALIRATRQVFANGLGLLGVTAPVRMDRTDEPAPAPVV